MHTTASDGSLSPRGCVERAAEIELAAIGITDHDTMAGNAEAVAAGEALGIEVVPGIEIAAKHEPWSIHLLGYFPDPDDGDLAALVATMNARRNERNPHILERLAALGCEVPFGEVAAEAGPGVVGRPHIAAVMLRRGYVSSIEEAFNRFLAKGAAAYVERRKPPAAEVIAALRGARAVPVLAHPGTLGLKRADDVGSFLRPLADLGVRGIEAYYHAHTARQVSGCLRAAERLGLIVTGGSDFHGEAKPGIQIGRGQGKMRVPYSLLDGLKAERARL